MRYISGKDLGWRHGAVAQYPKGVFDFSDHSSSQYSINNYSEIYGYIEHVHIFVSILILVAWSGYGGGSALGS